MIGVAMMLVGILLIGVALANPVDEGEVAADAVPVEAVAVVPPELVPGTTAPLGAGLGTRTSVEVRGRRPLAGFGEVQATITDQRGRTCEVCLLSAMSDDQRSRGLMEVTDPALGGYDGMLFEYPNEVQGSFWMRDTPLPLSIAFFDGGGRLVSTTNMEPCLGGGECPTYAAAAPYRFALEVPQGRLPDVGIDGASTIRINARSCTSARGGA